MTILFLCLIRKQYAGLVGLTPFSSTYKHIFVQITLTQEHRTFIGSSKDSVDSELIQKVCTKGFTIYKMFCKDVLYKYTSLFSDAFVVNMIVLLYMRIA